MKYLYERLQRKVWKNALLSHVCGRLVEYICERGGVRGKLM